MGLRRGAEIDCGTGPAASKTACHSPRQPSHHQKASRWCRQSNFARLMGQLVWASVLLCSSPLYSMPFPLRLTFAFQSMCVTAGNVFSCHIIACPPAAAFASCCLQVMWTSYLLWALAPSWQTRSARGSCLSSTSERSSGRRSRAPSWGQPTPFSVAACQVCYSACST